MTVTAIDNGSETITIDTNAPDARSIMLASASAIATDTVAAETKIGETAKTWGQNVFLLAYPTEGAAVTLDALIGDSKLAAAWDTLTLSEAGRKAKGKLEVYFSNARLVAEKWNGMADDARRDVLAGLSSIHYLAGQFRKAASDAKKEAAKEAKRVAAETVKADDGDTVQDNAPTAPTAEPATLADTVLATMLAIESASDDDFAAISADFAALVAAYDKRVNAMIDSGEFEPIANAA